MAFEGYALLAYYIVMLTAVAVLTFAHLHEYAHYFAARRYTSDIEVCYLLYVFPHKVEVHDIDALTDSGIRLSGLAPQVAYLPPLAGLYLALGLPFTIKSLELIPMSLYLGLLLAPVGVSPADLIAIFYPKTYREMAENDKSYTHREALKILLRLVRSEF